MQNKFLKFLNNFTKWALKNYGKLKFIKIHPFAKYFPYSSRIPLRKEEEIKQKTEINFFSYA